MLAAAWTGTLPGWLTLFALVATAFILYRGGGATALSTLQEANRVLERRVRELELQGKHDAATIAELRGRTDVTLALAPFMTWAEAHEKHAQTRHQAELVVLNMIADRLGPEPNGA